MIRALEAAIRKTLKQAAIEEGQWNEKRKSPAMRQPRQATLKRGMIRVAAEKDAALARGCCLSAEPGIRLPVEWSGSH